MTDALGTGIAGEWGWGAGRGCVCALLYAPDLGTHPYQALLCCVLVSGMKAEAGGGGPAVVRGACFPHQTWKEGRLELRVTKRESRNSTPTGGFPTLGSGLGSATFCVTLN